MSKKNVSVADIHQSMLDEICMAMEDNSISGFLDLATGEIIMVPDYDEDRNKIFDRMDSELHRYERIPNISSDEAYGDIEDFIHTLKNQKLQQELLNAIHNRKPFRRFKNLLSENPEEQIRWFDFHNKAVRQKAKKWLGSLGMKVAQKDTDSSLNNWVEKEIEKKKELIDQSMNMFVELASKIDGIIEIALFGSLAGAKKIAKDIDLMVFIENTGCINELAKSHRKVLGTYHQSPDAFVFTKDKKFLGNICHRKECPASSVDCQVLGCGEIKYIRRFPDFNIRIEDVLNKSKVLWFNDL